MAEFEFGVAAEKPAAAPHHFRPVIEKLIGLTETDPKAVLRFTEPTDDDAKSTLRALQRAAAELDKSVVKRESETGDNGVTYAVAVRARIVRTPKDDDSAAAAVAAVETVETPAAPKPGKK